MDSPRRRRRRLFRSGLFSVRDAFSPFVYTSVRHARRTTASTANYGRRRHDKIIAPEYVYIARARARASKSHAYLLYGHFQAHQGAIICVIQISRLFDNLLRY